MLNGVPEGIVVILLGGIAAMLVSVVAYSYRVSKIDPAKRPA